MFRPLALTVCLLSTHLLFAEPPHAHPDKGPHGAPLIELGNEEYHAELILDEKQKLVTVYVLDSTALKVFPIDAKEVAINLKHAGKAEQYKLKASPDKGDPTGQSTRFELKSGALVHALHHKDHGARLSLKIQGKSYTAKIAAEHGHDHKH